MKLKLGKIVDPQIGTDKTPFLNALLKLVAAELPIKKAFELKGYVAKIEEERKRYYELKQKLDQKYAEKGEDGKVTLDKNNQFTIKNTEEKKNFDLWIKEIQELLNVEIELPTAPAIEVNDLLGDNNTKLSMNDLDSLEALFPTLFPKAAEPTKEGETATATKKEKKAKKAAASTDASEPPKAANG